MDEELKIKEKMIGMLTEGNLVYFISEMIEADESIREWERYAQDRVRQEAFEKSNDKAKRNQASRIKSRLSQFTDDKLSVMEHKCQEATIQKNLLINDKEIINLIKTNIDNLQYDEEIPFSKALTVQTICMMFGIEETMYSDNQEGWKEIQASIANVMDKMSIEDLIMVYSFVAREDINSVEEYKDVFIKKINDMTEPQFISYLSFYDDTCCEYEDLRQEVIKKIRLGDSGLSEIYIDVVTDDQLTAELLRKANRQCKLNALMQCNLFRQMDDCLSMEVENTVKNFTPAEIIKYMVYIRRGVYKELDDIVAEKAKELKDEDIKFLYYVFNNPDSPYKRSIKQDFKVQLIADLMNERKVTRKFAIGEEKKFKLRELEYEGIEDLFSDELPGFYGPEMGEVCQVFESEYDIDSADYYGDSSDTEGSEEYIDEQFFEEYMPDDDEFDSEEELEDDEDEILLGLDGEKELDYEGKTLDISSKRDIYKCYLKNCKSIRDFSNFINVLCLLSRAEDIKVFGTINRINMENKSKKYVSKDIRNYQDFVKKYLKLRILYMNDKNSLFLLAVMEKNKGCLTKTMRVRLEEAGLIRDSVAEMDK